MGMKFRPTLATFGLGLMAACTAVTAQADGDPKNGAVLAYTCHGCHGVPKYKNAYPNYSVPNLGGQNASYIASALAAYAAGDRPHQTMHAQAVTLSEQDRADIAAYLQAQPIQPSKQVVGTPPPATQTCVACHGADGASTTTPDYPILAGQYADYLEQALRDYKSGKRKNPIMAGIVAGVDEKDFPALADFFASQKGLCSTKEIAEHGSCAAGD
jgi:cytochrome c553